MHNPITPLLITHASAGGVMLTSGLVAMCARKANTYHRMAGKIYVYATSVVGVTGFIIAIRKDNQFLIATSVFVLFMLASAYRSLYLKQLYKVVRAQAVDWLIIAFGFIAAVFLLLLGASGILHGNSAGYIPLAFGIICLSFSIRDTKKFITGPADKKHWLYNHIGGMLGSYIAGITAFLAVNAGATGGWPKLAVWLGPTFVGTPLIFYWTAKYKTSKANLKQELGLRINAE